MYSDLTGQTSLTMTSQAGRSEKPASTCVLAGPDRVFRTGLTGIGQVGQENKCLLVFRTDLTGLGHAGQENQRALGMTGPDRFDRSRSGRSDLD
ncbi:hypothetical protein TIFTF001_045351 [Ficus carica]|uniref:Uncharacterized protein n=1 Tax=Ficus carica TaxID=3494 RepID=A0AA87YYX0_FICCA|nr:hypothetical protein TIFTF001_045351 [Ficus carica]